MSSEYPDILGDLVQARERAEVNGVHYVASLQPPVAAPGEAANLRLWLQSCWDMPLVTSITLNLPPAPSPAPSVLQARTDVPLEAAEVGEVTIPIATAAGLLPGVYPVPLKIGVQFETRGLYVRSQKTQGQLDDPLLTFTTGMALSASMGLGYTARTQPEQVLSLRVDGPAQPGQPPDLTPTYLSHWTVADLPIQGKARQLVNDQRIYLLPKLTRQALYLGFLDESQARCKDADLPLHIGEAIFLAKILTFAVEHFLGRPDWQDAILVPAFSLAYRYDLPTNDPLFLIVRADYARIARLAISLSFGLLRQSLQREVWSLEEEVAVAELVADRVERGGALPAEFLYLPLILGGLLVAGTVQMPGEKLSQSTSLLQGAYAQRTADLAENPELVTLLDQFLRMAQSNV
jgi:hypothetical protein